MNEKKKKIVNEQLQMAKNNHINHNKPACEPLSTGNTIRGTMQLNCVDIMVNLHEHMFVHTWLLDHTLFLFCLSILIVKWIIKA